MEQTSHVLGKWMLRCAVVVSLCWQKGLVPLAYGEEP